jgi:hypothetical protein
MANMCHAHSVCNYGKTPLAPASDDLGILHEGDEPTIEDVLWWQLLDKDRKNDKVSLINHVRQSVLHKWADLDLFKLQSTILTLQQQLDLRPPIERIQELEKEYKNLDLILQGTQRENERCMAELDRCIHMRVPIVHSRRYIVVGWRQGRKC